MTVYDFETVETSHLDSPWEDDPMQSSTARDAEWTQMSSAFVNTGYREGITAGKESALQEGFDAGFAQIGVPLGRELGILRGVASAMLAFLSSQSNADAMSSYISEARDIATRLADVRFSDIAPRDLEAEQHAREHLQSYGEELDENEDITEKRQVEQLEDMMNQLTAGTGPAAVMNGHKRPGMEDVKALRSRLEALGIVTGVDVKTLCS